MRYSEIVNERSKESPEEQKARAEAQGFDTSKVWYHGTIRKFASFKIGKRGINELGPGIYFTGHEHIAGAWGRPAIGGRIIACYLRRGAYFDLARFRNDPQLSKAWNEKRLKGVIDELHPKHSAFMDKLFGPGSQYEREEFAKMLFSQRGGHISELLAKLGYIGAYDDQSQIPDQIVIFNPKDARRIEAKFDPEKADSERLLDSADPIVSEEAPAQIDGPVMWHGGRWDGAPEVQKPRKGRYEAGPGIYLTNKYDTARKYAKGGGATFLVTLAPNLRFAYDVMIPLQDGIEFTKQYLRHKNEIIADLKNNCDRSKRDCFRASVLINLTVNYEAGSGAAGIALAKFLADHGVDVSSESMSGGEQWLVVINPAAIKSYKRVSAADVTPEMRMLPIVK